MIRDLYYTTSREKGPSKRRIQHQKANQADILQMEKQDKKQEEQSSEEPPSYDETMADKKNEQENGNAPYVKFPHPINKHTAKRSSNKEFPGNQTLTYMSKK